MWLANVEKHKPAHIEPIFLLEDYELSHSNFLFILQSSGLYARGLYPLLGRVENNPMPESPTKVVGQRLHSANAFLGISSKSSIYRLTSLKVGNGKIGYSSR